MVSRSSVSPVSCAALGLLCGFYALGILYQSGIIGTGFVLLVFFILIIPLCALRVIIYFPPAFSEQAKAAPRGIIRALKTISLYAIAFSAGLSVGIAAGKNAAPSFSAGLPFAKAAAVSGVLLEDPRVVSGGRVMARLALREVSGAGGLRVSAKGDLPVFFPKEAEGRLKEFGRGCAVFSEGGIRESVSGFISFNAVSLHITRAAPPVEQTRTRTRLWFTERFSDKAGVWGDLALALLLGIRDNLDSNLAALYRDAGCAHVLALSGMHLAVIGAIIALLLKRPLGKKTSACAGVCIIAAYCFIVGPLPSLNRAALMYFLGALALLWSFRREGLSILCMAFIVQIILTPRAGLSLSFILSYLALAGIIIAGESAAAVFRGKIPALLLNPLAASAGAFIFTAAVTAYCFGSLRPAGIIAGLIVMPLSTVFMAGALVWLALDCIFPPLAPAASFALSALSRFMEQTVRAASRLPGIDGAAFMPVLIVSLAAAAFIVWYALKTRTRKNSVLSFT